MNYRYPITLSDYAEFGRRRGSRDRKKRRKLSNASKIALGLGGAAALGAGVRYGLPAGKTALNAYKASRALGFGRVGASKIGSKVAWRTGSGLAKSDAARALNWTRNAPGRASRWLNDAK